MLCDEEGNEIEAKFEKGDEDLEGIGSQHFKWLSMMEDFNTWMPRKDPNRKQIEKMTFNAWKAWQKQIDKSGNNQQFKLQLVLQNLKRLSKNNGFQAITTRNYIQMI